MYVNFLSVAEIHHMIDWVIDTDYKTYAMVWTCVDILDVYHFEWAWILGRTPQLDSALVSKLMDTWEAYDVPVDDFMMTQQTGCTY